MNATHSEQTRLLATGINNIAVAFIVIGVVTPVTAVSFGITAGPAPSLATAFFASVWFCAGAGLHSIVRRVLRSLKP
ncbi:MAG: hypothetical protein K2Y56_16655 [Methylobacterium sp.]|uniref:hypothetical protein n=1 Tax=Methylobacterium sp. TaxID=409 RepID=UPI0025DC1A9B|nr:hypothetical protein [Methylobacterium sp.]MBX9933141.1 hypothetical protein [Methylobacterium sp.]